MSYVTTDVTDLLPSGSSAQWARLLSGAQYYISRTQTDDIGTFVIHKVPNGTYTLGRSISPNGPWITEDSAYVVASNPVPYITGPYGTATNISVGPTMLNLQTAGADMSGVADSSAAWTTALGQLPSGGGVIGVPPGTAVLNNASGPLSGTKTIIVRGSGIDATVLKATSAVDHVLSLQSNGGVEDLTIDGGGLTSNAFSHVTNGTITIDQGFIRRAKCKNIANGAGFLYVATDTGGTYKFNTLWMEDLILDSPSSNVTDALAISVVDTCFFRNLWFRNLYRTPNFYAIKRLIGEGLYVVGVSHTNSLVFDSSVLDAELSGIWVDSTSTTVLMNAAKARISKSSFDVAVNCNTGNVATQELNFSQCRFTQGVNWANQGKIWEFDNCHFPTSSSIASGVVSNSLASGTLTGLALRNCTWDVNNSSRIIGSSNTITIDDSIMEGCRIYGGSPNLFNFTRGSNFKMKGNRNFVDENSGNTTVPIGLNQTAVVSHGLVATPSINDIMLTPQSSLFGATSYDVSSVTSTQFTITVRGTSAGTTPTIGWRALLN